MNHAKLKDICEILSSEFPDPKTELNYTNELTLLIAIILSAQTTDKMVNIATKDLFSICSTPIDFIKLEFDGLLKYTKVLNYCNTKTRHILKTCDILIEKFHSRVPDNFDDLISLPGVGRKTANVFLNVAHNLPTIAVDTHVFRVTNRLFGKNFTKPEQTEEFLTQYNTHSLKILTHHLFILHGRYVCKAKSPNCKDCKLKTLCKEYKPI